jgi:hypothetical protein
MLETIQSLWWGRLSMMERLSIASYVANGHPYHLYTYREGVQGEPDGIEIKNGAAIVPASDINKFRHLAHFADWFRYNLLLQRGGWWVDIDTVCLHPFDGWRGLDHVIPEQHDREGGFAVNNAYLRASPGSPIMAWIARQAMKVDRQTMSWEATANTLCLQAAAKFHISTLPPEWFQPLAWWEWNRLLVEPTISFTSSARAVHLWRAMWRQAGQDPDREYPPDCLYEQLKRRYAAFIGVP